jgi:catechol 2,3-dioxygenase-like lactoylglutathione lyase family enzyme
MSTTDVRQDDVSGTADVTKVDMKVEVIVIPVADVDRAKEFYTRLGWRLDRTPPAVVQFTPHGSACWVQFGCHPHLGRARLGQGVPGRLRPPGHATGARRRRHRGERGLPSGPRRPGRRSGSRAPQLLLARHLPRSGRQRLAAAGDHDPATRLPGRVEADATSFGSTSDLASAFRCAAAAHGEHEKRTGEADPDWPDWPDWYAAYMVAEQAGTELPT